MLIVSKFHDYYDIGSGLGIDKSIVYNRKTEESFINIPKDINNKFDEVCDNVNQSIFNSSRSFLPQSLYFKSIKNKYRLISSKDKYIFSVCGKLFSMCACYVHSDDNNGYKYFFNYNQMKEYVEKNNIEVPKGKDKIKVLSLFDRLFFNEEEIETNININYDCPIVVIDSCRDAKSGKAIIRITKNPCLKDYGFQRIVDPYTMYQNIMMYMTGVLTNNEDGNVQISDEDMKVAKGFNNYSFKTRPKD